MVLQQNSASGHRNATHGPQQFFLAVGLVSQGKDLRSDRDAHLGGGTSTVEIRVRVLGIEPGRERVVTREMR